MRQPKIIGSWQVVQPFFSFIRPSPPPLLERFTQIYFIWFNFISIQCWSNLQFKPQHDDCGREDRKKLRLPHTTSTQNQIHWTVSKWEFLICSILFRTIAHFNFNNFRTNFLIFKFWIVERTNALKQYCHPMVCWLAGWLADWRER